MPFQIVPQRRKDAALIDPLLDRTFGSDRQAKTVYRLREGLEPLADLRFLALDDYGNLLGSLRFWSIMIEMTPAILLGPLAVEPALQGQGIGKSLVRHGLSEARRLGHRICVVVGAPDYYVPFGFRNATEARLVLPGPVEVERFQVCELASEALRGVSGRIRRVEAEDAVTAAGAVA